MITSIIIPEYFDMQQIADSGQCFRINKIKEDSSDTYYSAIHKGKVLLAAVNKEDHHRIDLICSPDEYENIWRPYFDLNTDYSIYAERIRGLSDHWVYIKKAFEYSQGIRILNQDPFETLISFIISQRSNIPRIKKTVESICKRFGHQIKAEGLDGLVYYSFPTVDEMSPYVEDYDGLSLGYRDEYIAGAVAAVKELGIDYFNSVERCMQLKGVGAKVANCYALFALHDFTQFPVDVWIQRVIDFEFNGNFDKTGIQDMVGLLQQYMFYYERSLSGK